MTVPTSLNLDALAAAPRHHRLLLENDSVRVLDTCVEAGETVPLHAHQWPAAYYVLSWGDFVRRDEGGEIVLDSRKKPMAVAPGQAIWASPLGAAHAGECGGEPASADRRRGEDVGGLKECLIQAAWPRSEGPGRVPFSGSGRATLLRRAHRPQQKQPLRALTRQSAPIAARTRLKTMSDSFVCAAGLAGSTLLRKVIRSRRAKVPAH